MIPLRHKTKASISEIVDKKLFLLIKILLSAKAINIFNITFSALRHNTIVAGCIIYIAFVFLVNLLTL